MANLDLSDEQYEGMMVADGLDDAIIGLTSQSAGPMRFAYDVAKVIDILMKRDGMSYEDAREFFSFNIECAYVGETTPIWIDRIPE